MRTVYNLILVGILLFGAFFRLYRISDVPPGLHGDEASIGYNAYLLLYTGRDQDGKLFPLVINQWGDWRPAGYHYLAIPSVAIFGLTEFAVRFPGALMGILSILILYLYIYALFKDKLLALLSAFILAINPWHINLSRATSESIPALFCILFGAYLHAEYFIRNRKKHFLFYGGLLLLFMSQFFYHSARLFAPAYLIISLISYMWAKREEKYKNATLIIGTICFLILSAVLFIVTSGQKRAFDISIFSSGNSRLLQEEQIREDEGGNPMITRFFHNKLMTYGYTFSINYSEYFSGRFLFFAGGYPFRYLVPNSGVLQLFDFVFVIIGFSYVITKLILHKDVMFVFPLLFLLVGPIPAALTFEDIPNVVRSAFMIPGLVFLVAFGIITFVRIFNKLKWFAAMAALLTITICFQTAIFFHEYYHHTEKHYAIYRQGSVKRLALVLDRLSSRSKPVMMTADGDNVPIFYLFYWQITPQIYEKVKSDLTSSPTKLLNLMFDGDPCQYNINNDNQLKDVIYVNRAFCPMPYKAKVLSIIEDVDGKPDYVVLERR